MTVQTGGIVEDKTGLTAGSDESSPQKGELNPSILLLRMKGGVDRSALQFFS
jgi:hypothetical protein